MPLHAAYRPRQRNSRRLARERTERQLLDNCGRPAFLRRFGGMGIFRFLRRERHVVRALRCFSEDDHAGTLGRLDAMSTLAALSSPEKIFRYHVLVLSDRFEEAECLLDGVCSATVEAATSDDVYVNLYARAIRASFNGDEPLRQRLLGEASKLPVSYKTKRWLP